MKLSKVLCSHLSQLEVFEVNRIEQGDMYISEVIEDLNTNILNSSKIYSDSELLFDGLILVKTKFSNLRMLHLNLTSTSISVFIGNLMLILLSALVV
ncbi:hypothetical protein K502DRAFT_224163 [Neoconidiobolus thromboides FSU 785]|nr:hypothetical protein K502DRAFT_224163 [Neoconidiobolus thromboides FSU 785]